MPFDPDAEAIFAAFTTPAGNARKTAINDFVVALKGAGVWQLLDVLYVFAAHDEQAALLNWVNPGTLDATAVDAPMLAVDEGFTGDASSYISTLNLATEATHYTLGDGSMFAWNLKPDIGSGDAAALFGSVPNAPFATIRPVNNTAGMVFKFQSGNDQFPGFGFDSGVQTDGFFAANQNGNTLEIYRNGVQVSTTSDAPTTITSANLRLGQSAVSPQEAVFGVGASLDETQHAALYSAALAYLQANKIDFVGSEGGGAGRLDARRPAVPYWWRSYNEQWLEELQQVEREHERLKQITPEEIAEAAERARAEGEARREQQAREAAEEAGRQDASLQRRLRPIMEAKQAANAEQQRRIDEALERARKR